MSAEPTYAEASRALLRERFFNAANELLATRPWPGITMAELAAGAGVSRQTLYNEFGSREEFAQAFFMRETDRLVDATEPAITGHPGDAHGALAAAFDTFLTAAANHPVIAAIASGEDDAGLLPLITIQGQPLLERTSDRLARQFAASWADLDEEQGRQIAEPLVRLAISHAAMPTGSPRAVARQVADMLAPYLESLLAERSGRAPKAA